MATLQRLLTAFIMMALIVVLPAGALADVTCAPDCGMTISASADDGCPDGSSGASRSRGSQLCNPGEGEVVQ